MADKEKSEKAKANSQTNQTPKDAQIVMSILKELEVKDYEPRVVNLFLDFTYRYVTCILDDAKVYANHARKKTIELEDVQMATQIVLDKSFSHPPPRHLLAKISEECNSLPLPPVKPLCGLRLPPDRYCLTACNYKLRASYPPKKMGKSALDARSNVKTTVKNATQAAGGAKRQTVVQAKSQVVTIPKPVIKFNTTPKATVLEQKPAPSGNDIEIKDEMGLENEKEHMDFEVVE